VLSHAVILISESSPYVLKFSLVHENSRWISFPTIIPSVGSLNTVQCTIYDDMLVVFDRKSKHCKVYDLVDDKEILIGGFQNQSIDSLNGIYDSSVALSSSSIVNLHPNYEAISEAPAFLIAALFRRRHGIFAATSLFLKTFTRLTTVHDLKLLIKTVAPSARSPTAQLRLTRAIQFSGIANPHFLLIALIAYARILDQDMIALAKVPLIELFFHPACRHALESREPVMDLRLPIGILTTVVRSGLPVDCRCAENPLDFAEVCIGAGRRLGEARAVLLKARLDGCEDEERITRLEAALKGKS
jgi:hypothetical protein